MHTRGPSRVSLILIGTTLLSIGLVSSMVTLVARAEQSASRKRIVALYWSDKDYPGNVVFDQYFQATLKSSSDWIEYYPEYLDSEHFPGEAQSGFMRDYLRQKYADHNIDVVIALADTPLNFLLRYRAELFPTAPIVFIANTPPTAEQRAAGPGLTGFAISNPYSETMDLVLRMHPDTEQLFIVSGTLTHDKRLENKCRRELENYEGRVTMNYLTDLSPDELTAKVKSVPQRSIILYLWQQAKNEQGRLLETQDVIALVADSASVPIYGVASWQLGKGIVGGYLRDMEANGARAAEVALRIANGESAQNIPMESIPIKPMFDWRELKRWGISETSLPPGSVVRFRLPSFWDENRWYAIAVISLIIFQSALIFGWVIHRTRRKRAEEVLRDVEESLTIAVEASQMGTWDLDLTKDFSGHRNLRHDQIFGYTSPQAEWGKEIARRHIVEQDREIFDEAFARAAVTGKLDFEARVRWPDGSIHWMAARGRFYFDKAGQPTRGAGVNYDITQRKLDEEALRESEERFRNMADTAPVMIWVSTPNKLCTYFNKQWLDFTGRSIKEEVGDGWTECVHPDDYDRCHQTYDNACDRREPFTMEYRLRRFDGEFRWVLDSGIPRLSQSGEFLGYIGSAIDITERKAAEQALRDLSGQLIHAREDECARIARELHDDLNQRVALVSVELDHLSRNPPPSKAKLREIINQVIKQATDLSTEIHRMSHDLHPSKLVHLGLVAALRSLCSELSASYGLNIELSCVEMPAGLPKDLSICLYRIVQESLNNVVRHSGAKEAIVELRGTRHEVRLRVEDTGRGFEIESARSKKGLGLMSMRERLRLVGGTITIESGIWKGTRIEVRVPLGYQGVSVEPLTGPDKGQATASGQVKAAPSRDAVKKGGASG
jgi:PAS domain S-box-containing protein